ncbi:MAG TPA: GNAT family N-acetyltransferase [Bryobacteraceae bacterium]|nr:GNAT family N-acetyltransferase [Bryobacteraceae bacterium]
MTPVLETPRLWLRPLELADAGQSQPLFAQWEVVKHLSDKVAWPFPPDGVYRFYHDVALPQAARGEAWHWTLRLKSDPARVIGAISLQKSDEINRGFWLGLPWHGQGLMSEAAEVVTDYWFTTLGFPLLRVPKAAANTASRRISEKQGMRVVVTRESGYVCGRLLTEVWEITAEEWRARRIRESGRSPAPGHR